MSLLVDPHICPDCRSPLDQVGTCTGCGLRLVGPAAAELWQRMQEADRLVEQLRAAAGAAVAAPATAALPTAPLAHPAHPAHPAPTRTRPKLPNASVPIVLLALGGLCLLVAAIVFLAVAWGSLSLGAKTTIMLAVTSLVATGAVAVTQRGLRIAAETLWLVVAALVAVDLSAAYGANLLGIGRLDGRDAASLLGATLLGLAIAVAAWATTTGLRRIHGLVLVAATGTLLLAAAAAWTSEHNPGAVAVSVPLLAALALTIDRVSDRELRPIAAVVGVAVVISWLVLFGYGVDRLSSTATLQAWWRDLSGWPLLVAAVLAAGVVVLPLGTTAQVPARMIAAGAGLVAAALFVVGPSTSSTSDLLRWALATALLALVAAAAPLVWARPAAILTAAALVVWTLWSLLRPLDVIIDLPSGEPVGRHLPLRGGAAPWTAILAVLVVGAAAAALLRHLPGTSARAAAGRALIALGPAALALGATTGLLETEPTLVVAVIAWSGTLAIAAAMAATTRHHDAPLAACLVFVLYLVVVGLRLASASNLLGAIVATAIVLVLAGAHTRAPGTLLRGLLLPILAAAAVILAGFAAVDWAHVAGGRGDAAGLSLVGVASAVLLAAKVAGRGEPSRLAMEITGLGAGLLATAFPTHSATVAMVLTILGSAVAVAAILYRDREEAAWIGVALLGVATALRVVDEVRAPEVYTLPAAAVLLGAGWWRLRAEPAVGSARALSSGLTLALAPSLLLALDEPLSLRGVLVGVGGLIALVIGIWRLWAAPFVAGALTTAVLAVRHVGPVVDGLPRWISLGSLGVLLLLVGVTWEQRRRDVQGAGRYLASLH